MKDTDHSSDHSSYYILNREYFSECFDQTANTTASFKTYRLAIALAALASALFLMESEVYIAWFLLCLSGVELLSIRYKRGWWITRQMLSRAAGTKVNIRINDQGIFTDSPHYQQSMLWDDITDIKSTERGFMISLDSGSSYLSRSGLDEEFLTLLAARGKR